MLRGLSGQKLQAGDRSRRAAAEPEETLVHDARAHLTPAQMVEHKLLALLKSSDPSPKIGASGLRKDTGREQNTSFRMIDAMQEGRQRAATDRGIEHSAAKKNAVRFLQIVKEPVPDSTR